MNLWQRILLRLSGVGEREYRAVVTYMSLRDGAQPMAPKTKGYLDDLYRQAAAVLGGQTARPPHSVVRWMVGANVLEMRGGTAFTTCDYTEGMERLLDAYWLELVGLRVGAAPTWEVSPPTPPPAPVPEVEENLDDAIAQAGEAAIGYEWPEQIDLDEIDGWQVAEDPDAELRAQAKEIFKREGYGSTTLLQKQLSIGYGRASRIVQQLFESGFLGPDRGSNLGREVIA